MGKRKLSSLFLNTCHDLEVPKYFSPKKMDKNSICCFTRLFMILASYTTITHLSFSFTRRENISLYPSDYKCWNFLKGYASSNHAMYLRMESVFLTIPGFSNNKALLKSERWFTSKIGWDYDEKNILNGKRITWK